MKPYLYAALLTTGTFVIVPVALSLFLDHWSLAVVASLRVQLAALAALLALLAALFGPPLAPLVVVSTAILAVAATLYARTGLTETKAAGEFVKPLRLISFNVRFDNTQNAKAIVQTLKRSDADVVALFEAGALADEFESLQETFAHTSGCGAALDPDCGTLLLSRYPFRALDIHSMSRVSTDRTVKARIDHAMGPVTLIATHLTKPYFDWFQEIELTRLYWLVHREHPNLVVMGDFNATLTSPKLAAFIRRANLSTVWSEPRTWPASLGPLGLAIDHVLVGEGLAIAGLSALPDALGSNHRGVAATIVPSRERVDVSALPR